MLSSSGCAALVGRFSADRSNLLRLVSVSKFAPPLFERVKEICRQSTNLVFSGEFLEIIFAKQI